MRPEKHKRRKMSLKCNTGPKYQGTGFLSKPPPPPPLTVATIDHSFQKNSLLASTLQKFFSIKFYMIPDQGNPLRRRHSLTVIHYILPSIWQQILTNRLTRKNHKAFQKTSRATNITFLVYSSLLSVNSSHRLARLAFWWNLGIIKSGSFGQKVPEQ